MVRTMTGTVKALEWERYRRPGVHFVKTLIGTYAAYADGTLQLDGEQLSFVAGRAWHETEAAAQDHFNTSILSALTASASEPASKGLRGPFGWLNGVRGLSEENWTLEGDPVENSAEYFAIPLYALTDPFEEAGKGPALAPKPFAWLGEGAGFKSFTRQKSVADRWQRSITVTPVYGLSAAFASPVPASEPEPVAWSFELAGARNRETGKWAMWSKPKLSFEKPCVPEGSVRNLRALTYANPVPTPDGAAKACQICGGPHDNDVLSDICQDCESSAPWRNDALSAALTHPADGWRPTHRHVKRGTEYTLLGIGKMQAEKWQQQATVHDPDNGNPTAYNLSVDMREVAIYRSVDDGSLWARPREEFEDGRFAPAAKPEGE